MDKILIFDDIITLKCNKEMISILLNFIIGLFYSNFVMSVSQYFRTIFFSNLDKFGGSATFYRLSFYLSVMLLKYLR